MTNGDLHQSGNVFLEIPEVAEVEVMPRIDAQAKFIGKYGRFNIGRYCLLPVIGIVGGILFGVEFYAVSAVKK